MSADFNPRKLAETLIVLNKQGEILLSSLYNTVHLLDPQNHSYIDSAIFDANTKTQNLKQDQPRILSDQNLQPIAKAILKKFPETPELNKLGGYQILTTEAKTLSDELEFFYDTFVQLSEFTELAQAALLACEKLSGLVYPQHSLLTDAFFELLSTFVFLQLQLSQLTDEKKIVLGTFNFLFAYVNSRVEPNYQKVVQYFNTFDKPITVIHDTFAPISNFITQLIQSLASEYMKFGNLPVEIIRKDGIFSVTSNLKTVSVDDGRLKVLPLFNKYQKFVIVSFLCCPGELLKQQPLVEILKSVLSNNLTLLVSKSGLLNPYAEFEAVVKANSKLSKIKPIISDSYGSNITKSIEFHSSRREYLRYILKQIVSLVSDHPFLICYKFPVIESILAFTKEELLWYFMHHDKSISSQLPKVAPKPQATQVPNDPVVIELIFLVSQLQEEVLIKQKSIQEFYANLFVTHYGPLIENIISEMMRTNVPSDLVTKTFQSIFEDVTKATAESQFEGLRLNYQRLLVHFHSVDTTIAISTVAEFINVMNEIAQKSRYIDSIPQLLEDISSLKFLYYFRPILQEQSEEILNKFIQKIKNLSCIPKIASEFIKNNESGYQKEWERIGSKSVQFVDEFYNLMSKYFSQNFQQMATIWLQFESKLLPIEAIVNVPDKREKKKKQQETVIFRPGQESEMSSNQYIQNLPESKATALYILKLVVKYPVLTIHDVIFYPKEYFKEAILQKFKHFLMNSVFLEEQPPLSNQKEEDFPFVIKRPSVFLNELTGYLNALESIDDATDFKVHDLAYQILLEQLDLNANRKILNEINVPAKLKGKKQNFTGIAQNQFFIITYSLWYSEYIKDRGTAGTAIISSLKKMIQSSGSGTQKAQYMTDFSELCALCKLIGPSGVRLLDERLMATLSNYVKDIKDIMNHNLDLLIQVQKTWVMESKFEEHYKKFKQLDELVQKAINIGFILEFRNLLYKALNNVLQVQAGGLVDSLRNAHNRYPPNIYSIPEFLSLDNLSNYAGFLENVDVLIRSTLQFHCRNPVVDQKVYLLMPYAFALAVRYLAVDASSAYQSQLDSFENNAQCLAIAVDCLMTYLISITTPNDMDTLVQSLREFIQVTATILLKTRPEKDFPHQEALKASYFILLKYVQNCRFLNEEILEEFFPYSMIRSTFSEFFRKTTNKKKLNVNVKVEEEIA